MDIINILELMSGVELVLLHFFIEMGQMPVRYIPAIPPEPKEFVEPNASDHFIWWLFRHQCVKYSDRCTHAGQEINEIIPRSRSKNSILNWENRVLMCRECHNEYHRHGVNSKTQEELQEKRIEALKLFGREEYVNYIPLEIKEFDSFVIDKVTENFIKEYDGMLATAFGIPKEMLE